MEAYKDTWDRRTSDAPSSGQVYASARDAWLLFLDDFDKEMPRYKDVKHQMNRPYKGGNSIPWWLKQLYRLLDDRYRTSLSQPRPTVVIANQPWEHVRAIIRWMGGTTGEAALDRLDRLGARVIDFDKLQVEPWRPGPAF